jgi:hypothetical protein
MSLASDTRDAVRAHPFLYDALRAGVLNYTATARFLDLGDVDTVTAALQRYADELDNYNPADGDTRIEMQIGLGPVDSEDDRGDALIHIGDTAYDDGGSLTGIIATGEVSPSVLATVLNRFRVEGIDVETATIGNGSLIVLVSRRDGPIALRLIEAVVESK